MAGEGASGGVCAEQSCETFMCTPERDRGVEKAEENSAMMKAQPTRPTDTREGFRLLPQRRSIMMSSSG